MHRRKRSWTPRGTGHSNGEVFLPVGLPEGATIQRNGPYLIIHEAFGHPIAGTRGRIPYHRFVLFESLGRPVVTRCHWCGYFLPWRSTLANALHHVVCADHLDGDKSNNSPENLVPSCSWCNMNRNWAEAHEEFWDQWRRWMADVPPEARPNLPSIARDFGISADGYWDAKNGQNLPTMPECPF